VISSVALGSVLPLRRGVEIFERHSWLGIDGRVRPICRMDKGLVCTSDWIENIEGSVERRGRVSSGIYTGSTLGSGVGGNVSLWLWL